MPYVVLPWLAEHAELAAGTGVDEVAADLVRVGLEEEEIHTSGVTGPLTVGRVVTYADEKQKNGKTIRWCQVDVGEDSPRGIVCGAHNFAVDDLVVVALPGAVLPGDFAITARKTYGHVSDGMICSARELGLGEDHEGILVLTEVADDVGPGTDAIELLGLGESVLEINVTPDRGYCFSVRGVAREYALATGGAYTDPGLPVPAGSATPPPSPTQDGFAVVLADDAPIRGAQGADRFVARVVRGVDVAAPSPDWMQRRLRQSGMRPVSLPVDVTNYVMLELGQPTHAYDLGTLTAPIVVRRARAGERMTTLDDVDRRLDPEDLLITDSPDGEGSRAIGIAGVMGGAATEVGPLTRDVLVEAAHFDTVTIARAARRHRLPSEASRRFERGVDPELPPVAAQRVVDLLVQLGGGRADEAVTDVDATTAPATIVLGTHLPASLVGVPYTEQEVTETLRALGADVRAGELAGTVEVTPPTWRPDLVEPVDLVEEVVRLRGYEAIGSIVPAAPAGRGLSRDAWLRRSVERALAEAGLVQVLTYPFVSPGVHDALGEHADDPRRHALRLANPLTEEAPELRTSLLATLTAAAARNLGRGAERVAITETGMVTHGRAVPSLLPDGGAYPGDEIVAQLEAAVPDQPRHVAAVVTHADAEAVIGLVLRLARVLGVDVALAADPDRSPFHPGRCARVTAGDTLLGHAGELAPQVCAALELPARTVAFELDLDALVAAVPLEPVRPTRLSTFPVAKEDVALVVDEAVPAADVLAAVRAGAGELAESVELFDVYTGDQLGAGKKSLAFALRLRADDRTLTAAETAEVRDAVVAEAGQRVGGVLRG
ncbi:phenylalanyl-tRNA synthetase, beta subunit [Beutenbergia cavernae DSM 12333]|uniref:Phenylalanine--tRNA ligase beta subunit n=1 Tax=Beutenbergia cavernae (strain ATCC BAA-8 / DSM 12333 / CCUG 43141 / JCM 11478 / NBRC 16432 / NCIMB 13614 / HKI 0122) TaxID=471853 RepID=C5BW26_BEUC1|nr:phenylalanine--tRNA ligase subunit beta [Beutenbergia cavernae]ACQ80627.1 phenylalanyl-tRNA synthetase, beta subunit [Beutenbergia cavernae DSM 12333]